MGARRQNSRRPRAKGYLTSEQLSPLLAQFHSTDTKLRDKAFEVICQNLEDMLYSVASKWKHLVDIDEGVQIGRIAVLDALATFDGTRSTAPLDAALFFYCRRAAENNLKNLYVKTNCRTNRIPNHKLRRIGHRDDLDARVCHLPDPYDHRHLVDVEDALQATWDVVGPYLSAREREVVLMHFKGVPQSEVARRLGVSVKVVDNAYTRFKRKLGWIRGEVGYPFAGYERKVGIARQVPPELRLPTDIF
jgi:RNA polymerase sigma factor (sigma-70 family)